MTTLREWMFDMDAKGEYPHSLDVEMQFYILKPEDYYDDFNTLDELNWVKILIGDGLELFESALQEDPDMGYLTYAVLDFELATIFLDNDGVWKGALLGYLDPYFLRP